MNKQKLLESLHDRPRLARIEKEVLGVFLNWSEEANQVVPMSAEARSVIDKLWSYQRMWQPIKPFDVATVDSFLAWVEEAKVRCVVGSAAGYEVGLVEVTFVSYGKALVEYQGKVRQEVIGYWQH